MKTTAQQDTAIAEAIANKREDLFSSNAYDRITDAIYWAWENWDKSVLATYYEGEKPAEPSFEFRKQWVENELGNVPENWEDVIESFEG